MEPLNLAILLGVDSLSAYLGQVHGELERVLPTGDAYLGESFSRLANNSSKQLRSSLVISAAGARGKKIDQKLLKTCTAIELIHLGSLVHDDVIDRAPSRWNRPSLSQELGSAQAIVVGDYLLAKASGQAVAVNLEIASLVALTIEELCLGESRELAQLYNTKRSMESMYSAIEAKTGALIAAACQVGGICAGASKPEIGALGSYGRSLGIAFQLIDDLLDLVSTTELMAKPVHSDALNGIYTLPVLLGLKGPRASEIKKLLPRPKLRHSQLVDILINDGSLEKTASEIRKYNHRAQKALENYPKHKTGLGQLPDAYLNWAINNLVAENYRAAISRFFD